MGASIMIFATGGGHGRHEFFSTLGLRPGFNGTFEP